MGKIEVTLLSRTEADELEKPSVLEQIGEITSHTDYALLLSSYCHPVYWYTSTLGGYHGDEVEIVGMNTQGILHASSGAERSNGIRPAIKYESLSDIPATKIINGGALTEIEFGEYPQTIVDDELSVILTKKLQDGTLKKTGKTYTSDSNPKGSKNHLVPFEPKEREEYEYNGKKYVLVKAEIDLYDDRVLSNGKTINNGDYCWMEVEPIKWVVIPQYKVIVAKTTLLAGLRVGGHYSYDGNIEASEIYQFLNKYFINEITPSMIDELSKEEKEQLEDEAREIVENYNSHKSLELNFDEVSEEDIIRGSVESGLAVFLHGQSSEGKSARVKQIDPDCVIVYLRNTTPEMLNGKSAYNSETGEMVDVKPSWLVKLEKKCEAEPDKLHIVFFDEITNALPSVQGMAYNIVLDKEVNGMWKLPENARIVAAGNDMADSLAANQLAEPLFNRFAHVYIKTTTEGWLKWASEHNIHPAIYAFIAYTNGEVLRSEYNGETPNADPRKWEMASKMLYATGNPEMLRALVGEDITKSFVEFCRQAVITLEDVLMGNYDTLDIESLNTAARHSTVIGLTRVDEANLATVRNFVRELGEEFVTVFDNLWVHGDKERIEVINKIKNGGKSK